MQIQYVLKKQENIQQRSDKGRDARELTPQLSHLLFTSLIKNGVSGRMAVKILKGNRNKGEVRQITQKTD